MATKSAKSSRPTTCGALAVTQPTLGQAGCARLPRHKGEHRSTLTAPRVTSTKAQVTKDDLSKLAAAVEAGAMTASEALALVASITSKRSSKRTPSKTAQVTSEPTQVTKTAIVWGAKVTTKSGVTGRVTKIDDGKATIILADKSRKTFVLTALTRVPAKAA